MGAAVDPYAAGPAVLRETGRRCPPFLGEGTMGAPVELYMAGPAVLKELGERGSGTWEQKQVRLLCPAWLGLQCCGTARHGLKRRRLDIVLAQILQRIGPEAQGGCCG
eukprot:1159106-Pelagomonas_calceolata.AAC.4